MNQPEDIIEEIVNAITTDSFHFIRGTRPEQNFNVDELDFNSKNGVVLMDSQLRAKWKYTISNYREASVPVVLFFAYKTDIDADTESVLTEAITPARAAADEFILRARQHDFIVTVAEDITVSDVFNVFDLNLSGVLLECNITIENTDSSCLS